jgi:hypothetical protein
MNVKRRNTWQTPLLINFRRHFRLRWKNEKPFILWTRNFQLTLFHSWRVDRRTTKVEIDVPRTSAVQFLTRDLRVVNCLWSSLLPFISSYTKWQSSAAKISKNVSNDHSFASSIFVRFMGVSVFCICIFIFESNFGSEWFSSVISEWKVEIILLYYSYPITSNFQGVFYFKSSRQVMSRNSNFSAQKQKFLSSLVIRRCLRNSKSL